MAPVPRLIVVKAILWVINTLHDPGSCYDNQLPPVFCMLAKYGADAILARLLMYSWTWPLAPCLPLPMVIGELYMPPVDKYPIYARCSGPCSHAKLIYSHYLLYCSHSSHPHTSSHPYGPYGPCSYFTRVLYHVAPCKPLWPGPSLPGMDQRGVPVKNWWMMLFSHNLG